MQQQPFEKAMINDLVYKNPARGIRLGPHDKKEPRVLTPEEQPKFFECSKGTFYDNLFVVAVSTGLRPDEANIGNSIDKLDKSNFSSIR